MGSLLAGAALLVLMLLLASGYVRMSPRLLAGGFRTSAGLMLAVITVALLWTGRLLFAMVTAGFAWGLLFGTVPPWQRADFGLGSSGAGGGQQRRTPPPKGSAAMSRKEALNVLGLEERASEADIRAAHRRLIQQTHPDKGGTSYLAAKINEAKDVLLGRK